MKQKLIELLKDSPSLDALDDAGYVMGADHLIANGVTIQKWISVSERLPETDHFLAFADGNVGEAFQIEGEFFWQEDAISWEIEEPITEKVTHWMPLPSTEGLK